MKKLFLAGFCCMFSSVIFAQQTSPVVTTPVAVCPQISEITKDPKVGNWVATTNAGYWKSYHMSFATELTQFVGAQWVGAKVGQLTCVYHSQQTFTFEGQESVQKTLPVLLAYHTLADKPTGKNWHHAGHGVYNCLSINQANCPFVVNQQQQTGDIFQEAASLKFNNQNTQSPLDAD